MNQKHIRIHPIRTKKAYLIIGIFLILAIVCGFAAYSLFNPRNYAVDFAVPFEEKLIDQGASKLCSSGDSGHSISNDEPHYSAHFKIPSETSRLENIAKETGFTLIKKEPLEGGAVVYEDVTKEVNYPGINGGRAMFKITVWPPDKELRCGRNDLIKLDAQDRSFVLATLSVMLPPIK